MIVGSLEENPINGRTHDTTGAEAKAFEVLREPLQNFSSMICASFTSRSCNASRTASIIGGGPHR